ncbi:MAG TPA: response regulator [Pirellulales bacterium]|nr:response regulator [Pirellulales bacterium]
MDDEDAIRLLMSRAFSREGFACEEARDGAEALELVLVKQYDAVVTDIRMPHLQGTTLTAALLELEERPAVIVLTGEANMTLMRDLIKQGVEDVVFKPFDPGILAAKVRSVVERRRSRNLPAKTP